MKTDTKDKILRALAGASALKPKELTKIVSISSQALHRHLKKLVEQNVIRRLGTPPNTFYQIVQTAKATTPPTPSFDDETTNFLAQYYTYISPEGRIIDGADGFAAWCSSINEDKRMLPLAGEYQNIVARAEEFRGPNGWIETGDRIKTIFDESFLDQLYYQDFYSLPKFGKTRLGALVLHGKGSQNRQTIRTIARRCLPTIEKIIEHNRCDSVAFIPHSIPRRLPFLKEFQECLNLKLPVIELSKAYSGDILVAQKSLSKLEERIQNARNTIFVNKSVLPYKRVLLIDDAVGSGASLNETAHKLKQIAGMRLVVGFAVVGSYKGFEVIQEI